MAKSWLDHRLNSKPSDDWCGGHGYSGCDCWWNERKCPGGEVPPNKLRIQKTKPLSIWVGAGVPSFCPSTIGPKPFHRSHPCWPTMSLVQVGQPGTSNPKGPWSFCAEILRRQRHGCARQTGHSSPLAPRGKPLLSHGSLSLLCKPSNLPKPMLYHIITENPRPSEVIIEVEVVLQNP